MFLFSTLAIPTTAKAEEWFLPEPLLWDARFMFDGSWRDTEISPGNTQDSQDLRYREQFSFKKRIHLLDQKIATLSFDLRPTFSQSDYINTDNTTSESDSNTLNYAVNSSFLHGAKTPLSLTAGFDRTTGITSESLGGRADFEMRNKQITLNHKNIYFPSSISYTTREQDRVQESGFSANPLHTNDSIKRLNYRGRSSKMNLDIERLDYNDFIYDRHYSYNREQINHAFNWGKSSSLSSRLANKEQKDFGAYKNTSITENLRLQHTKKLFSTYQYAYSKTERTTNTVNNNSSIDLNHQLYSNLTTQVGYQRNVSRYNAGTGGKSTTEGPRYSASYNKKLPMKNSLISLGINGSRLNTQQSGGTQLVDVLGYTDNFEIDLIILNQLYIDITTIEVINSTTSSIYNINIDYTVTQSPNGYTEIHRIDGGSISIDEAVTINYSHWSPGNTSDHNGYFFRINLDNIRIYHNQSQNKQTSNLTPENLTNVYFPSGFLPITNSKESTSGISYNLTKESFKLGLGIETKHTSLNDYVAQSRSFKQNLSYAFSTLTTLTMSANQSSSETTISEVSSVSANANLNIRIPSSSITVKPHLSYRQQDDSLGNDDKYISEGVDLEWRYYLITFNASLNHYQWNGTTRNSEDNRLMFNLIRRSQ
ncbi:MAG: hypothetical protein OEY06_10550 [Gammaproteobacteria bacterium]|nr:hypothetical protein [Gammaproteobacteria bacterium]